MKWKEAAIVLLDPADDVIKRAAYAWRERYRIPTERCFSVRYPDTHSLAGQVPLGFGPLKPGSLSFCSLGTKLMVVCHGDHQGLVLQGSLFGGAKVAQLLDECGLREVGLLAFKACLLGKGLFLDVLAAYLTNRNIGVGWLVGYKDVARTITLVWDAPGEGARTYGYEAIGPQDLIVRTATHKLPDKERVKIVKGNRFVSPPAGSSRRYAAQATWV